MLVVLSCFFFFFTPVVIYAILKATNLYSVSRGGEPVYFRPRQTEFDKEIAAARKGLRQEAELTEVAMRPYNKMDPGTLIALQRRDC